MPLLKSIPLPELVVRAIVIRDGAVLVNQTRNHKTGEDYCALPGGHVDPGESCVAALVREFREELDAGLAVQELAFVSESIYAGRKRSDRIRHEVVLYWRGSLEGDLQDVGGQIASPERGKRFRWLPLEEIESANLLPVAVRQVLRSGGAPLFAFEDSTA